MTTVAPTLEKLSPEHFEELIVGSSINPDVVQSRGYRTLYGTEEDRAELAQLGFSRSVVQREETYPALLVPLYRATGEVVSHQLKPASPRVLNGGEKTREVKYENPKGSVNHVDVPAFTQTVLQDTSRSLWITEGMKKVDSLTSHGRAAIGLTGVFNWRRKLGTLGDWEDIPIKGRDVVICFDSDAKTNRNVQLAMRRLGAWLESKGARQVYYLTVPEQVEDKLVKGVDDFFAAGGTLKTLSEAASKMPPGEGPKDASFTDAVLAETVAKEELEGKFCWARGIGWLKWNGHVWEEVAETQPTECVRAWALVQFQKALAEQQSDPSRDLSGQISGWRSVLSRSRISALVGLAKGIIEKDPTHFDSDPDLLCVKNGYVDLSTGTLHSPDPDKLMTKSAGCTYKPDARHALWSKALEALPLEVQDWYWDRIGQAATGYMTPDDTMVIAHGDGENGKSTLVAAIKTVLGSYAVLISDRVLLANPDAHPTELMDLRGARYAILEETPEARRLDVHRLKTVVGTEEIKARRIRQDPVEFSATHSLFINTNFRPIVSETDHGTWRRLALLSFPYTFKKPGTVLEGPNDKHGDPLLRLAFKRPTEDLSQAVLAWIVEGARRWFERGKVMLPAPERVEADTFKWRAETDLILGFVQEALKFVPDGRTPTREMLDAFNEWIEAQHHKGWTDKTFSSRFGAHEVVKKNRVEKKRVWLNGKGSKNTTVWLGVIIDKDQTGAETDKDSQDPWSPSVFDHSGERGEHPSPVTAQVESHASVNGTDCSPCSPPGQDHDRDASWDRDRAVTAEPDHDQLFDRVHRDQDHLGPEGLDETDPFVSESEEEEMTTPEGITEEQHNRILNSSVIVGSLSPEAAEQKAIDQYLFRVEEARRGNAARALEELKTESTEQTEQLEPILGQARGATGFDLETRGTDWLRWPRGGVRPFISLAGWGGRVDPSPEALCAALSASGAWVGHHVWGFDVPALTRHAGVSLPVLIQRIMRGELEIRDTELQAMLADPPTSRETKKGPNFKSYKLDAVLDRVLGVRKDERGSLLAKKYGGWTIIDPSDPDYVQYCAEDVKRTEELHSALPWTPYMEREMKIQAIMTQMTVNGFRIDQSLLDQRIKEGEEKKDGAAKRLSDQWGMPVGSKSPLATNVGQAWLKGIYDRFGVKRPPMTKSGKKLATSAEELKFIADHPKCPADLRTILKLMEVITTSRTIYGTIKDQMINGRVHVDIWPRQASGRWSAGFFTTMGKKGDGVQERAVFLPEEGHVLVAVDLGQIDARIVAAESQDSNYLALFAPGKDLHTEIAIRFFGSSKYRDAGKPITHSANYGVGRNKLIMMGNDPRIVDQYLKSRDENFPRLIQWQNEVREIGASGQLLYNGFGRPLKVEKSRAYTQAPAQVGQSGTRDMMGEGLLRLASKHPEVLPMLRGIVHDEIVASVPIDQFEDVSRAIVQAYEGEWAPPGKSLTVPIIAGASRPGANWADCY